MGDLVVILLLGLHQLAKMSSVPLAKHLGSNGVRLADRSELKLRLSLDKKVRDKAVQGLATFLSDESNPPLSPTDMEKLWKGIFYCESKSYLFRTHLSSLATKNRLLDV